MHRKHSSQATPTLGNTPNFNIGFLHQKENPTLVHQTGTTIPRLQYRETLFFRASASYSKTLNVKSIFNTVKNCMALCSSGQARFAQKSWMIKYISIQWKIPGQLFFRASASYSQILNVESIFSTVKIFRATVFQGKRKLLKNPEW